MVPKWIKPVVIAGFVLMFADSLIPFVQHPLPSPYEEIQRGIFGLSFLAIVGSLGLALVLSIVRAQPYQDRSKGS